MQYYLFLISQGSSLPCDRVNLERKVFFLTLQKEDSVLIQDLKHI